MTYKGLLHVSVSLLNVSQVRVDRVLTPKGNGVNTATSTLFRAVFLALAPVSLTSWQTLSLLFGLSMQLSSQQLGAVPFRT